MPPKENTKGVKAEPTGTLGTFSGVFTPSILTILGIILFRRLGYVVGQGGLFHALVIIAFANVISIITSISVAAIATNVKVKGGGDYYLISRTLGLEFGGAIGIVLFLAQSVSVAFYCLGFGEAIAIMLAPSMNVSAQIIAVCSTILLYFLARAGADWATKFQYGVMVILILALISFFWGGFTAWDGALIAKNWDAPANGLNFWLLFAIFFPAVTGFTQGVSMSGDLMDPGKSIPSGTFLAVFISTFVYFAAALFFAAGLPQKIMMGDYESMAKLAHFGWLIDAGVIAATLSSAMASFMGAPRILQALSRDKVFPLLNFFAKGVGPTNNPRNGIFLTLVIALITVGLGNLNLIAPVVSMCFLVSYGLLNYATYFEASTESPSFRPRFKWFNKHASLLGAVLCLGVMLAINPSAGIAAAAVIMAVFQYLKRMAPVARWSDGKRSHSFQVVREHLMEMTDVEHPRDWRPQILAFAEEGPERINLLRFAQWLEGSAGITSAVQVIEDANATKETIDKVHDSLALEIKKADLKVFPLAVSAPDLHSGLKMLLQAYGVGPLSANIVLLNRGVSKDSEDEELKPITLRYGRYLKEAVRLGRNVISLKATEDNWNKITETEPEKLQIDIFWFDDATSRLCLLLAYLMTRTELWEDAGIRILAPRPTVTDGYTSKLAETLDNMRIECTLEVIEFPTAEEAATLCAATSLVFLPFKLKASRPTSPVTDDLPLLLSKLPATAMVLATEDIDLTAEPDEGKPAEIAAAVDEVLAAQEQVKEAKELAEVAEEVLEATEKETVSETDTGTKVVKENKKEVNKKIEELNKAKGKVNKALDKVEKATKKAEEMGIIIEPAKDIEDKDDDQEDS